ncbi:MAG: hypothetical protein EOM66_09210 [Clostridia bacterium]|nr:hypothetical protein [Clostridia bacterium]
MNKAFSYVWNGAPNPTTLQFNAAVVGALDGSSLTNKATSSFVQTRFRWKAINPPVEMLKILRVGMPPLWGGIFTREKRACGKY